MVDRQYALTVKRKGATGYAESGTGELPHFRHGHEFTMTIGGKQIRLRVAYYTLADTSAECSS